MGLIDTNDIRVKALREATSVAVAYLDQLENATLKLPSSFFLYVHKYLLAYNKDCAGRYRLATDHLDIPQSTFTPFPAWQINNKIRELVDFINNKHKWGPAFKKYYLNKIDKSQYSKEELKWLYKNFVAWYIHHQFVIIHPYCDGNGRMARLLMCLVYRYEGLFIFTYPAVINKVICDNKKEYLDSLNDADEDNYITGVDYMLKILTVAYKETQTFLKEK